MGVTIIIVVVTVLFYLLGFCLGVGAQNAVFSVHVTIYLRAA